MCAKDPMSPITVSDEAYRKVAKLGFPNGGTGECYVCGKERQYSYEEVVKLLKKPLPMHCGRRIDLKTK